MSKVNATEPIYDLQVNIGSDRAEFIVEMHVHLHFSIIFSTLRLSE